MANRRPALDVCRFAVVFFIMSLGVRQLSAPTPIHAQTESSESRQGPAPGRSGPAASGTPAARALFQQRCVKCHGADGTGKPARDRLPEIPDFTKPSWQAQRKDAQLLASILDGKGEMPNWRGKLSEELARSMVAHVRTFAPTSGTPKGTPATGFNERFHQLQEEMNDLQRQEHKVSKDSQPGAPSQLPKREVSRAPAPTTSAGDATSALFQQRCVKCHGADGTGKPARDRLPEIPDFTKPSWQAQRKDAQLLASILDGKNEMPRWRGKLREEQARSLVTHIRAFAPATGKSGQGKQGGPTSAEPAETQPTEARPPSGLVGKVIRWLGEFHPPTVHFPIALLSTAAVAEFLAMVTGKRKRAFNAVSRYCVWFGTLTAVATGLLGWFLGGFRLTDPSWIKMTHRWVGTSTVPFAGLVLVLSERSRHPNRQRTRIWFRVALLIVAVLVSVTGFLGGGLVFGLDHYRWPQ